jgi:hypothetical protein
LIVTSARIVVTSARIAVTSARIVQPFPFAPLVISMVIKKWHVSKVTDLSNLFSGKSSFSNQDISKWDVSAAYDFTGMFSNAGSFD